MKHPLEQPWTLTFTHPTEARAMTLPATVPGNVEIDLMKAGLLADPYPADDLYSLRHWEGVDDWVYRTQFDAVSLQPGQTVHLVFEGVDTIADVVLNGQKILRCENMLVPHELDVTHLLKPTGNALEVFIFSANLHARKFPYTPFQVSRDLRQEQAYLRKARHMWGWDNAPRLVSAGIWRPVHLEVREAIRFEEVYTYTQKIVGDLAYIGFNWRIHTPDVDLSAYSAKLTLSSGGIVELEHTFDVDFIAGRYLHAFRSPKLWWPVGYGEAHLYDLEITLLRGPEPVAHWQSKFGIREIELVRTETTNANGDGEFLFRCNGEKIYINGTNWKSLDALLSQAEQKVEKALDLCRDLNCNMIRVWGGGIYEDRAFFDYCDRHGLLVWQDFMFACEFPPRDEWYKQAVAIEVASVIRRMRNHASLAVWCGDNEVDMTVFWGLYIPPALLPSHNEITRDVIPRAISELDPYRPYVESSPYIADSYAKDRWAGKSDGNGEWMMAQAPEQHIYATGAEDFFSLYRRSSAHFVSETGPFFINSMSQTKEIVEREIPRVRKLWDLDANARPYAEYHQKEGYVLLWKDRVQKHLREHFQRDFSLDNWEELALGVNTVTGILFKFCIEYSRIRKWRKSGVIWWSLLDMWPMMFNYSVVDSAFRRKEPVYGWIRQSQQTTCLVAETVDNGSSVQIYAINDSLRSGPAKCKVSSMGDKGELREIGVFEFTCVANETTAVTKIPAPAKQELWVLEMSFDGATTYNHFLSGAVPYDFEQMRRWIGRLEAIYRPV